jgi:hypothetical protein
VLATYRVLEIAIKAAHVGRSPVPASDSPMNTINSSHNHRMSQWARTMVLYEEKKKQKKRLYPSYARTSGKARTSWRDKRASTAGRRHQGQKLENRFLPALLFVTASDLQRPPCPWYAQASLGARPRSRPGGHVDVGRGPDLCRTEGRHVLPSSCSFLVGSENV